MKNKPVILIVDDEPLKVLTLEEHLKEAGYSVFTAVNGLDALDLLKTKSIDAVVTDVRMPGLDGLSLLEESMKLDASRPVLVMTGYEEVHDAVRAMKAGAIDYVVKPISGDEIALRIQRALAESKLAGENLILRHEVQRLKGKAEPVIVGLAMALVQDTLDKAAPTDATVLIVGETGTGKEVCARYLHTNSLRAKGPFIVVPCAALPQSLIESELFGHEKGAFTGASQRRDGYFTAASGGTILLDDVDDLPIEIQGRLLHVLQSHNFQRVGGTKTEQVDVRVVASTKKDLASLAEQNQFRDDLMYRLSVVTVKLPPLRSRKDNIPVLAEFFLKCSLSRLGRKHKSFTQEAIKALMDYNWPGNVRELEHAIESTVILHTGEKIDCQDLPPLINSAQSGHAHQDALFSLHIDGKSSILLDDVLLEFERALLKWAFEKSDRRQGHAAKLLGIPRSTFQYRWSKVFQTEALGKVKTDQG